MRIRVFDGEELKFEGELEEALAIKKGTKLHPCNAIDCITGGTIEMEIRPNVWFRMSWSEWITVRMKSDEVQEET